MRPHKKLELWKFVIEFVSGIYKLTKEFPIEERYGLTSQIKRASVSVASNIAEVAARKSAKEKTQFFSISKGSLSEIDAQLEIALTLQFINESEYNTNIEKLDRISRMLQGLVTHYEKT